MAGAAPAQQETTDPGVGSGAFHEKACRVDCIKWFTLLVVGFAGLELGQTIVEACSTSRPSDVPTISVARAIVAVLSAIAVTKMRKSTFFV